MDSWVVIGLGLERGHVSTLLGRKWRWRQHPSSEARGGGGGEGYGGGNLSPSHCLDPAQRWRENAWNGQRNGEFLGRETGTEEVRK